MAFNFLPTDYELASEVLFKQLLQELSSVSSIPASSLVELSKITLNYLQSFSLSPQHLLKELDSIELPVKQRERSSKLLLLFFKFAGKKVLSRAKLEDDLNKL